MKRIKNIKITMEAAIYTAVSLFFGFIFFRQIIFSNFDLLLGDVGDARFYGVIQEHWWQFINGNVQWLSPAFFFPTQGVLGYSVAGFLTALPYIALRFTGLDNFTAYQLVLFILTALGWIGAILFLRTCLKLSLLPTIIGSALFVFPNVMANLPGHTQLFNVYLIPYLAIGIYFFLPVVKKSVSRLAASGIFLAVWVPAMFYTSYYSAWFSLFFIFLLAMVFCVLSMISLGGKAVWKDIIWKREHVQFFLPYCIIGLICFIPFLLTYVPTVLEFGYRSYSEISSMLPSFIDYINIGSNNYLWGKVLHSFSPDLDSRPMAHELIKGVPFFLLLAYFALLAFYISKIKNYKLIMSEDHNCKLITTGREASKSETLTILAAGLSITIFLAWLLMLKIHGLSLWWLVAKTVPGASGIRAVYRFQHILVFPLAVVIAIALQQYIDYAGNPNHSYLKRFMLVIILVFSCLLLLTEQFNTGNIAGYSKKQQIAMLAAIDSPPGQAKIFALSPSKKHMRPFEAQINAMLIAQKYGLYTINGYSGQFPQGWNGIYYYNRPEYMPSVTRWIKCHKLDTEQIYFLDMDTGHWNLPENLLVSTATQIDRKSFSKYPFTRVGCIAGNNIISTGKRGFLIFGPYSPMNTGRYRFVLKGRGMLVDTAWADIVSKKGKVTHCKFSLNRTSGSSDVLVDKTVTLDEYADDLEIRVYVGKKDNILIKSYKVTPIKKTE